MFWCDECFVIMLHLLGLIFVLAVHSSAIIRARKGPRVQAYKLLAAMIAVLLISVIVNGLSDSVTWQNIVLSLRVMGALGCAFSFFWLAVMVLFDDNYSWRRTILSALPALAAMIVAVILLIDERSPKIIMGLDLSEQKYFMLPFSIISSIYVIFGLVLLFISLKNTRQDKYKLMIIYIVSTMLPLTIVILNIYQSDLFIFDPIPLTAAFVSSLLALAATRLHLIDIMPLARRDIMNEMDSLLAIVRNDGMIIDCNEAFARVAGGERRDTIGKNIKELIMPVMEKENELANLTTYTDLIDAESEIVREIELNTLTGRRYFEVMVKPFYTGRNKLRGRLIRLTELSRERQLRQLLADQNKQLAAANYSLSKRTRIAADLKRMTVRNQLARELHDQLGHTIIMALSSIDRIDREKDNVDRWEQLDELMKNVSELLQRSLPEKNGQYDAFELKDRIFGISAILSELKQDSVQAGIQVEFDIQGPADDVPADHLHDLSQIFRETMTNAVKHGKADKIDYFMMINDSGYDVIIADNGTAEAEFEKGFGLKSIEKRVESLGGTVRFQNEKSGFAVFIKVPLKNKKSS